MLKSEIIKITSDFIEKSEGNYISEKNAISENLMGMKIFEEPIFAFGSADDNNFKVLKETSVIGEHFILPKEWLPGARTVVSFFLPFSEAVRESNKIDMIWPSAGWLHGRIEGQVFLNSFCRYLNSKLKEAGFDSVVPALDNKFWSSTKSDKIESSFSSNWSERHVAFICGLGTFGLSKGIITRKGMAGRLGSIVTELYLEPCEKNYDDIYEYCSMCGVCSKNCPAGAISIENGKDHIKCSEFLDSIFEEHNPRYGCGKCQVAVPCENIVPKNRLNYK
ncbi:epoxyqueuosine reductase QueG [Sedimentibacter acidaminivorans]|uniref:Epoxyqueuosine reductase QueG n=1 Tax=Sedimentibacter acidaminivorans TaxID=913099 RepID=A0ABS4GH55_9FIRM|nr:4Fe-4S binding protein [Sedimentibacter acidaminivorans]MBP1927026.1 epoxyqueuosine reductase QueG [Sedimentibacter acidaminivorans]